MSLLKRKTRHISDAALARDYKLIMHSDAVDMYVDIDDGVLLSVGPIPYKITNTKKYYDCVAYIFFKKSIGQFQWQDCVTGNEDDALHLFKAAKVTLRTSDIEGYIDALKIDNLIKYVYTGPTREEINKIDLLRKNK